MEPFEDIKYDADVLIAGAGPSGSICAYYLAKAGKRVILIDSESFPRDKICGDFVSPVALKELINIGLTEIGEFKQTNVITGATVYLDGKPLITKSLPNIKGLPSHGRVIPRIILDNWILEAAKKAGVQAISSCSIENYTVYHDHVTIECKQEKNDTIFLVKMLVGADGSSSKVSRIMNGKKPSQSSRIIAVRAYFENVNCDLHQAELFFSSKSFPGYSWFFPTGTSTANVGVGMTLEVFPKKEVNLKELLMDMIENDLSLKAKLGNGTLVNKIVGWPLSVYNPNATIVKDRVLLTGDAAGLINPLNGEGIQYALQSGRWAAESILKCWPSGNLSAKELKIFERTVRNEIGYSMSLSNIIMQLTRNRNLNPLWLILLKIITEKAKKDEKYANLAGGILSGMIPTNKALTISFLGKTFLQCIVFVFAGRFRIFKLIKKSIVFGFRELSNVVTHSRDYWSWIKNIIMAAFASIRLSLIQTKTTTDKK